MIVYISTNKEQPANCFENDQEKEKALNDLKMMGNISITTNVIIIQPKISLYVINVYVRRYNKRDSRDNIRNNLIDVISDYFIDNERFDRIVKSDIIKTIKNDIDSVDSVNIEFVCKKNEDYHREGSKSMDSNYNLLEDEVSIIKDRRVYTKTQYNKNAMLGLDPVQGDIVVDKDELPVLRGGWYDRNGVYYNDVPSSNGLSSVNIIWTGSNEN